MGLNLLDRRAEIASRRIVVGFDGFADTIDRVVRETASGIRPESYFPTIRSFGEYLIAQAEKSCSLELKIQARQLGGNLPYVSRVAGLLGLTNQERLTLSNRFSSLYVETGTTPSLEDRYCL